jgi:hypothetical protein
MKNLLKIILPTGISIIGSIVLYQYLVAQFEQMEVIPGVKNDYPSHFHYSLYFFCFTYLFALIALPFIIWVLSEKWSVKKGSIGMKLLIVEVLALILVWLLSPPDLISRILNYGMWQLPIAVNFISLIVLNRKKH